ncbi:methyl-accepting chemotaxis protein [Thioalkalivibrio sp. ALR17-21]|uniref:methyl-accepting chemotaxis protein n=1 Tax=Thioalkalivibrio sp. ALR17-21 TaxID=1269813 RepID=UPI0004080449|nr:methyl-accepting chemotaxis protein [Thioalkalivibrio sp. ALR17-21]
MGKSLSIRAKIQLLVALPLIALIVIALLSVRFMGDIEAGVDRVHQDRVIPLQQLKEIADDYAVLVIDAVNKADHGMLTAEEALQDVRGARSHIDQQWETYMATELTAEEARLAEEARGLFRDANADLDRLERALSGMSGNVSGELSEFNGPLYASIDPISAKINELVDLQLRVAGEEATRIAELHNRSVFIFIAVALAGFIVVLGTGWMTYRGVAGPLGRMRATMEGIVSDHDLARRVDVESHDELGSTAICLNTMLDEFQNTIGELRGMTDQMASAAEELSAVSTQTKTNLDQQGSQTEQVSTAMNEMTATVQEVARNASDASSATHEADRESREGGKVVESVVGDIGRLATEVGQIAEAVQSLDEQSQKIGSVLDVIRGIAEQTNLLALNAAIEAARAGEQGRGFAVVADEVRTLASRTQDSTADIQSTIENLQAGTRNAVDAMGRGREMAENTASNAQEAGDALSRIVAAVERIRDMNTQIASAAEEQNSVAEEINRNIISINEATSESLGGANQTETASHDLTNIASRVRDLASRYRIGQ